MNKNYKLPDLRHRQLVAKVHQFDSEIQWILLLLVSYSSYTLQLH